MIAKLTTGNGFSGALKYDLRDGKLMEMKGVLPDQIKVLDAKDVCFDFDQDGNMVLDVKQVAWDFRQQAMAYRGKNPIEKPVYHWALSYHPDDIVTNEQMLKDTEEFLERMGFGNTQYVVTAHRDSENPHVHVIANIVDNDGKRIPTYKMIDKAHKVAADITKAKGYTWGEKASKKTVENAYKPREKARYLVESIVKDAIDKVQRIEELPVLLKPHNVECIIKHSSDGVPVGISFSYDNEGQLHKFRGSELDRKLSARMIRRTILERDFPFNSISHIQYIIHGSRDASIYRAENNKGTFRKVATGKQLPWGHPETVDMYEIARQALLKKVFFVQGDQGPASFYEDLLSAQDNGNYRVGDIFINQIDQTVTFGQERIFGDSALTAPVKIPQQSEPPQVATPAPKPTPQPAPQPRVKTVQALAKLKNVPSADKQSTKEAINKSELIDNNKKKRPGIKI